MLRRCLQNLENGQRCNAPATDTSKYCRHHDPELPPKPAKETSAEMEPLILPAMVDKPSALAALNTVFQALGEGRIKRSVADTLLSAIKLANRLLTEISEAGLTVIPAASGSAHRDIYVPTLLDVDEFTDIMQNGTFDELRDHIVAKQTGTAKQAGRASHDKRGALTLAASGDRKTDDSRPALPSFAYQPDVDPATARIIKDILAQSHQMIETQNRTSKAGS